MQLRVIGAGLGRTGTLSLKSALETLLGAPCYHMMEAFEQGHIGWWNARLRSGPGVPFDWDTVFEGFEATVDWPAAALWRELATGNPDALVLLSHRSPESWWKSASNTIFPSINRTDGEVREMFDAMLLGRFVSDTTDAGECMAAFERHNAEVREAGLGARLVEWQPGDGWEPLCRALGTPIPDEPFPHANSTEDFLARLAPR